MPAWCQRKATRCGAIPTNIMGYREEGRTYKRGLLLYWLTNTFLFFFTIKNTGLNRILFGI